MPASVRTRLTSATLTGPPVLPKLVRTYDALYEVRGTPQATLAELLGMPLLKVPILTETQGEAVGYAPDGRGYYTVSEEPLGTAPTLVQSSLTQEIGASRKRSFDVYGLWKIDSLQQLRISANNLMAESALGSNIVNTNGLSQAAYTSNQTYVAWSVKYELKF